MASNTKIRVGLQSVRELEIEVEDADKVVNDVNDAIAAEHAIIWIVDTKETRHGIVAAKLAFIQVDKEESKTVGFG